MRFNNYRFGLRRYAVAMLTLVLVVISACSQVISGVRNGPIESQLDRRTTGEVVDDNLIETKARVNLAKASPALAQSRLVVVSFNGVVLLAGQVPNESLRTLAVQTVNKIHKVRLVHDELSVGSPITITTRANDAWLTAKIKSEVFADHAIRGGGVKVVTEDGVVYLMGLTTSSDTIADDVTEIARSTAGVQKVVRLFEYVDSL